MWAPMWHATCPTLTAYKADRWAYIASYEAVAPTANIKEAMYVYGPIAVGICAGPNFQAYRSGIMNLGDTCADDVNHSVTLVGWFDDNGTDNGYWIVKNSWGPLWGESGYMRVRYGVSNVGYAANFVEFTTCPVDPPLPNLVCTTPVKLTLGRGYNGTTARQSHRREQLFLHHPQPKRSPQGAHDHHHRPRVTSPPP